MSVPITIPITIVSGYLGAGKTTLINRVLNDTGDLSGLAILVNDFGDVNIDAELIRENSPGSQIIGLSNGCVCCSIQDDFTDSLESLLNLDVNHVLLEASGVAAPGKLKAQCQYPGFHPRDCFVLVDAEQFSRQSEDKYVGYLVKQQVEEADALVVTKLSLNPEFTPPNTETICFNVDDSELLRSLLSLDPLYASHQSELSNHSIDLETLTLRQHNLINEDTLSSLLDALPASIQRVKGFVATEHGQRLVQQVGSRQQLCASSTEHDHQLVFIASPRRTQLPTLLSEWSAWFSPP
jgi:G3E family GTPase